MGHVDKMFENLNTAVVACDADFKITYAKEKCKQIFKATSNIEGFVGNHMRDCHKPKTMEKLEKLFKEYKEKKDKFRLLHRGHPGRETHYRECSFL